MLVVEAREIGRGRLLAVDPEVLERGRAGQGAMFILSNCLGKSQTNNELTIVGVAHPSVFDKSDES